MDAVTDGHLPRNTDMPRPHLAIQRRSTFLSSPNSAATAIIVIPPSYVLGLTM